MLKTSQKWCEKIFVIKKIKNVVKHISVKKLKKFRVKFFNTKNLPFKNFSVKKLTKNV